MGAKQCDCKLNPFIVSLLKDSTKHFRPSMMKDRVRRLQWLNLTSRSWWYFLYFSSFSTLHIGLVILHCKSNFIKWTTNEWNKIYPGLSLSLLTSEQYISTTQHIRYNKLTVLHWLHWGFTACLHGNMLFFLIPGNDIEFGAGF